MLPSVRPAAQSRPLADHMVHLRYLSGVIELRLGRRPNRRSRGEAGPERLGHMLDVEIAAGLTSVSATWRCSAEMFLMCRVRPSTWSTRDFSVRNGYSATMRIQVPTPSARCARRAISALPQRRRPLCLESLGARRTCSRSARTVGSRSPHRRCQAHMQGLDSPFEC
jgi:hypothetical protein